MVKLHNWLHRITTDAKRTGQTGLRLQARLFVWLILFLVSITLGLCIIFYATGIFTAGIEKNKTLLTNELTHLSNSVSQQFGDISVRSVALAENLSYSIQQYLTETGVSPANLAKRPEMLEALLDSQLPLLSSALFQTKSSGAFLVLDATVNPSLPNASNSRAGLFIKNMEPNIISSSSPNILFIRGPANLFKKQGFNMHSQWALEFDVESADYFHLPINAARKKSSLPLSRLYYWAPNICLPNTNENIILCSTPLVTSDGTVIGVCGFEISEMLFKLSYTPDNTIYNRIFCMLSHSKNGLLDPSTSLFAGSYTAMPFGVRREPLTILHSKDSFNRYSPLEGMAYAGLHTAIKLYPSDSVFGGDQWILSLLMPEQDLDAMISSKNQQLMLFLALLLLGSIAISAWISKKYIKPVTHTLHLIQTDQLTNVPKTRIPEIDDLIEFLTSQDEPSPAPDHTEKNPISTQTFSMFGEFVKNIETLSPAERAVFNLYMKGYTAQEIADILYLSINTIKTHNRRIYMKLNVTSRKELMIYVQMMEEQKHPDA